MTGWGDEDARRVGLALRDAREKLIKRGDKPDGADIVFEVIRVIYDIERREKTVRGHIKPKQMQSVWLFDRMTHEPWEREEDAKQRMVELTAGESPEAVFGIRFNVSPQEIAIRDAALMIFRSCLIGFKQEVKIRDWRILERLSLGRSAEYVARRFHISPGQVRFRKKLQCDAIWSKVKYLLPTGVVLKEVA